MTAAGAMTVSRLTWTGQARPTVLNEVNQTAREPRTLMTLDPEARTIERRELVASGERHWQRWKGGMMGGWEDGKMGKWENVCKAEEGTRGRRIFFCSPVQQQPVGIGQDLLV